MTGGFDPGRFTAAPLQTEGVVRFTGPPDAVFAQVADHLAMTKWVPLLKAVQVIQPGPLPPGQSTIGTTRVLTLRGRVTIEEEVVHWDPPHSYAYTTQGKLWPLWDYVGFMGVQPAAGGGGNFVFREYFGVDAPLRRFLVSRGIVMLGTRAVRNLSGLIGGTSADFRRVPVPRSDLAVRS